MSSFLTLGNTTVDLFVSGLARMPAVGGDEFTVSNLAFCDRPLEMVLGGNGAIAAYVLARLGARVTLCSATGTDPLAEIAGQWLAAVGVSAGGVTRIATVGTSTTTVVTDAQLNRISFHYPGATHHYAPGDFPVHLLQPGGVLLASAYPLLPAWRPHGFIELLAQARRAGMTTALDIGPAIGRPTALDELRPLLPAVDFLLCNGHELAVCTGEATPAAGMAALAAAGAGCVVVKQGREGVSVRLPDGECVSVPGFAVEARFTVGAGDAFNAGFLFALKQGRSIAGAATFANAVAARVVSAARGALGAASLVEVEALLAGAN